MRMRRFKAVSLTFGLVAGCLSMFASGVAAKAFEQQGDKREGLIRGVTPPVDTWADVRGQYRPDGVAVMLSHPEFKAKPADAVTMAREFVAAHAQQLGYSKADAASLEVKSLREDRDLSVVRFQQQTAGLPVYGSDLAVTVLPDGRIVYVANSVVSSVRPVSFKALAVDQDQALLRARSYLGANDFTNVDVRQGAFVDAAGTHVIWKVRAVAKGDIKGDWELLIDASNGEMLRAEEKTLSSDGSGLVFNPDPLSSTKSHYTSHGYQDNNDADSPQLSAALRSISLKGLTLLDGSYKLSGPYASCADFEEPYDNACPVQASDVFNFKRSDRYFEAVNTYYHVDTYLRYVNEKLGIKVQPYQYSGGVQFDPHGVDGADNSHYSSATGQLAFGQGGVDDAEDADVVIHELGHGLHDWLTGGNLSQVEGLSEGVGDYLAVGYSRDLNQWRSTDAQYNWVMNWDGHNEFWPGRVTYWNTVRHYPAGVRRAPIHEAGQYWSACNLIGRAAIGGPAMDRAFLKGLSMTGHSSNQKAVAQAVIAAAWAMGYNQTQLDAIAAAYNKSCTYDVQVPTLTASL